MDREGRGSHVVQDACWSSGFDDGGAPAAAPGSSKGGESAEMSGATKAFATELKKINKAYYNELFKFERDD